MVSVRPEKVALRTRECRRMFAHRRRRQTVRQRSAAPPKCRCEILGSVTRPRCRIDLKRMPSRRGSPPLSKPRSLTSGTVIAFREFEVAIIKATECASMIDPYDGGLDGEREHAALNSL